MQFEWDAEKAQIKGNTEAIFVDMMTIPMTVPRAMAPYLDDKEQDHSFESTGDGSLCSSLNEISLVFSKVSPFS